MAPSSLPPKVKMTIDEAMEFAREWSIGMTMHEDSQGWRVVCLLLAEEITRLRAENTGTEKTETDGQSPEDKCVKRWRFSLTDFEGTVIYVDRTGGIDGDTPAEEFIGTSQHAACEGDRRVALWESRTGNMAAKITRESFGAPPDKEDAE